MNYVVFMLTFCATTAKENLFWLSAWQETFPYLTTRLWFMSVHISVCVCVSERVSVVLTFFGKGSSSSHTSLPPPLKPANPMKIRQKYNLWAPILAPNAANKKTAKRWDVVAVCGFLREVGGGRERGVQWGNRCRLWFKCKFTVGTC